MDEIEVLRVKLIEGKQQLRAFVDIIINGALTINGVRIMEDAKGYWVGFPQNSYQSNGRTKYAPVVESSEDFKQKLREILVEAYNKHQE